VILIAGLDTKAREGDRMATRIFLLFPCMIAICAAAPSGAQMPGDPAAELDALSRASITATSGLALARKQIAGGDLMGAMAAVERILISHPESDEALLLHASLVCRLDDPEGALIEFDELRGRNFSDQLWAEATAPCDAQSGTAGARG
jgi:Tfp pilus assembly protein PilF